MKVLFPIIHINHSLWYRYLGIEDKQRAGQVCRLWHELVYHPSLWTTVSLKNIKASSNILAFYLLLLVSSASPCLFLSFLSVSVFLYIIIFRKKKASKLTHK